MRSEHLPDFLASPLIEVVLGVQFDPPKGYQQIHAGEVWQLFRAKYSNVQELPPLPPAFETFGRPSLASQLKFVTGATHDRFWFVRPDGDQLIQFQQDRLLHNWRKVEGTANQYPRFPSMISAFREEIEALRQYLTKFTSEGLVINQCEVSYINHIAVAEGKRLIASDWLRCGTFCSPDSEDFSIMFREITYSEDRKPQGRLTCEALTGIINEGQRMIQLTLTNRGAPRSSDIASALEFLEQGHELIVNRFAEVTTKEAHKVWGRVK